MENSVEKHVAKKRGILLQYFCELDVSNFSEEESVISFFFGL